MMTIIFNWFVLEVAGLWPLIWHFGIGGVLLIGCGLGWYFSPVHKVDFIWAAVVVSVVIASTSIGVSLGEKRKQAQWDAASAAALENAKQARIDGVRDVAHKQPRWLYHRPDRYNRDRH